VCVAPFAFSEAGGYPSRARSGMAGCVAGGYDRAEVLGVERAGLPFGERRRRARFDADAGFAVRAVEDVGAVAGGGHPRFDDRLWGGQPHGAPGDVLTDHVPRFGVGEVTARTHPVERRLPSGGDVSEVVFGGHFAAVLLGGVGELRVELQRALAVALAFPVDQAHHRRADLFDVGGRRGHAGVGARRGRGARRRPRRDRSNADGEREQQCESGACHGGCIDSRARRRKPQWAGLDTFGAFPRQVEGLLPRAPGACHVSAGGPAGCRGASGGAQKRECDPRIGGSRLSARARVPGSPSGLSGRGRPPPESPPRGDHRLRAPTRARGSHA
jgi:hypothetical protein